MSAAHRHVAASETTRGYQHTARGAVEDQRAHGAVCHVERCACGAVRETNSNGRFVERGRWVK